MDIWFQHRELVKELDSRTLINVSRSYLSIRYLAYRLRHLLNKGVVVHKVNEVMNEIQSFNNNSEEKLAQSYDMEFMQELGSEGCKGT